MQSARVGSQDYFAGRSRLLMMTKAEAGRRLGGRALRVLGLSWVRLGREVGVTIGKDSSEGFNDSFGTYQVSPPSDSFVSRGTRAAIGRSPALTNVRLALNVLERWEGHLIG